MPHWPQIGYSLDVHDAGSPAEHRLAEVMAAVSLITDMARGQALESAIGAATLATRLARRLGLPPEILVDTYYTGIARTLGCTSTAADVAPLVLGEDRSFSYAMHICDLADRASVKLALERHFASDRGEKERHDAILRVLDHQGQFALMAAPTAHQAVGLTRRLPLPDAVPALLEHVDARWDGMNPLRKSGPEIPIVMRIVELAVVAELYRRAGGIAAAVEVADARAGGQFDPSLCAMLRDHAAELFVGFSEPSLFASFLDEEPAPRRYLDEVGRRQIAEASADYTDTKSRWFVGHSRVVAAVARAAAERLGLPEGDQDAALFGALLHDVGRCGVANRIWDHPGPLTERHRQLAESHSVHTEAVLMSCAAFRPWVDVAGGVHERCDGSGYHRGRAVTDKVSQVVAAADVYVALTHDRPWRSAFSPADAAELLLREVDAGRISRDAGRAVLECCGHEKPSARAVNPDGLTKREIQVLALLARGLATKEVAAELGIAFKTADNHVQNLYRKIGATSRAAAALYAVERGLV